ncbi:MAG: ketoacyl-ACP synthase III [Selenomonadaceae bacterium]|nr:ketoacyl-ACP synthase III [Selenomonadaceae bacterium]
MGKFACIRAIATYLPPQVETNEGEDQRFIKKLGIQERHLASKEESAGDLAFEAAENLFRQYDIRREDMDFILFCVQHPDYQMPTTACELQSRLGIPNSCGALDYNLGCSGYSYGLALAKGLMETGMAERVLLLTSSVYLKYINKEDHACYPLFGDGATATYLSMEDGVAPFLHSFVFGTDGSRYDKIIIPAGGSRNMPRETPEVFETDERGNTHSNYEVAMDGTAITYFTLREVPPLVDRVLEKAGLTREDLDYCVFHQANKFMLDYVRKKCKLLDVPFHNDIERIGNTVSGTIPFGIEEILEEHDGKNLKNVLLAGFGVGLSWVGCIADLSRMMDRKYTRER